MQSTQGGSSGAAAAASKQGGRMGKLAFWLVATVIFFGLTTQRMMLSNESSALELLTSESNKFMDLLHRNHGDAIIKADAPRDLSAASLRATMSSISTSKSTPATTATASAAAKSKSTSKLAPPPPPPPPPAKVVKDTRSFAEMLGDYVDAKPEPAGGTKAALTPLAAKPGSSSSTAAAATKRGQKVKQPNLVEAEDETADKQAVRLGAQHPPPKIKLPLPDELGATTTTTPASTPKPKPKPKPKPQPSPLDSLPPPPDRSYHPLVSPRAGTDISPENQLSALRCRNQSSCIVPALQLAAPLKIYFCRHPARHGVRFYYLVREGLHLHPNVHLVPFERIDEADFVVYLPGSSPWHLTECTNSSLKHRMLVLDEFDGYNLFHPFERIEQVQEAYGKDLMWYFMYFKRSFVARRDGKFLSHPHINQPDVFPMTYAIADAYISPVFQFQREIDVLCTLRGSSKMVTRMRVQEWIAEYAKSRGVANAITEQVNSATRTTLSQGYFQQMFNSKIIVTVNPANWEGDFRLWESMATGALIFVDPIFVPHSYPLLDGVHAVYFSNDNKTDLFSKLDHYRAHPEQARAIAQAGYLHAMKYHRTVNLVDYVLRSAHLKRAKLQGARPLPQYRYTAQFLNHQTVKQSGEIKKNDKPGAYHHDHLDHHDHSLVRHHVQHHAAIHGTGSGGGGGGSSTGVGTGSSSGSSSSTAPKEEPPFRAKRNPLLHSYPSLT